MIKIFSDKYSLCNKLLIEFLYLGFPRNLWFNIKRQIFTFIHTLCACTIRRRCMEFQDIAWKIQGLSKGKFDSIHNARYARINKNE